jgi:uncharacterized protein YoxC
MFLKFAAGISSLILIIFCINILCSILENFDELESRVERLENHMGVSHRRWLRD